MTSPLHTLNDLGQSVWLDDGATPQDIIDDVRGELDRREK